MNTRSLNNKSRLVRLALGALVAIIVVPLASCTRMSTREQNLAAGFNGGFEATGDRLPYNWYFHLPPLERGDMEVSIDPSIPHGGEQALKLVVHRHASGRGWQAPGLFQVVPADEGATYRIRLWVKTEGADLTLGYRSELAKTSPEMQRLEIGHSADPSTAWRLIETTYTVPADHHNLRLQLEAHTPGTVWIDDVQVEKIDP